MMMNSVATRSIFSSEGAWPLILRRSQLSACQEFLYGRSHVPRVLRVFGSSGSGKSFLVRELMVQAVAEVRRGLGIYVDVPPGELEAFALLEKLDTLLGRRCESSRDFPSFVDRKAARAWASVKGGRRAQGISYGYSAFRDLVGQVPAMGPFLKALMPRSISAPTPTADSTEPMRFLMRKSKSVPVFLAIDNTQFLPFALRELMAVELAEAGPDLRLLLVERVDDGPRLNWLPLVGGADVMDVELGKASLDEVTDLVSEVFPDAEDAQEVAATVFRRSEGNLKSVWYQLRLIASRRDDQGALPTTYADVILTLPTAYQAILRFVVFTVGGLTLASLATLLKATDLRLSPEVVRSAITDLAGLGLLVVNGDNADRVRVEHDVVARVVSETTPEDEKLELRSQVVKALSTVLDESGTSSDHMAVLYDRLFGIVNDTELRQTPALLAHLVQFVQMQSDLERHHYLASICRDSVCWDVLDTLPSTTVRSLLDAIQKSAMFSFGLIASARLRQGSGPHEGLASLYEAKYLVQLFRYEDASAALERAPASKEKRVIAFNILLNLAQDEEAAEIVSAVHMEVSESVGTEQDYVILRNAGHLFSPEQARTVVGAALEGFQALGRGFGVATALNNLGIVELGAGSIGPARGRFESARRFLAECGSSEVYQPLVNLAAVDLLDGKFSNARNLLLAARDAVPRSLLQDKAMLDLNDLALEICGSGKIGPDVVLRAWEIVAAARRTRDLRFIDLVAWFADSVEGAALGRSAVSVPTGSARRVDVLRGCGRVPLELFVPRMIGRQHLDVPFVLSPHWRY